jgi:hypothetical protein
MSRGRKRCVCGNIVGVRTKICGACNTPFLFKPSFQKEQRNEINWRELVRGDWIRVISGSGPYFPVEHEDDVVENINTGYYGKFKVKSLEDNGIHAYPIGKQEAGHCFIYMGKEKVSKTGTVLKPHKIVKIKSYQR